jgi:hypothetical protein
MLSEDLIGIGTIGQQPGQGLHILVLDRVMGGRPVVAHQGIQPSPQHVCQRLSTPPITN